MTTYKDVMSDYMTINMPDGAGSSSGGTNVNIGENLNLKGDCVLKNPVIAEYVWISGDGESLRSKCKTLSKVPDTLHDIPFWNFDGSSTGQATGDDSEVFLIPVRYYPDPLRGAPNIIVLCKCCLPDSTGTFSKTNIAEVPAPGNNRSCAEDLFLSRMHEEPWFGIEQEYTMMMMDGVTPLGWPKTGYPEPQGKYYCGNGTGKVVGRCIVDEHYNACLYAGINISGTNAEVMLGQWEYQVGPTCGIKAADDLWLSRFLLHRVAEKHNVMISFDAKPVKGDWNGSGCHTNYSTKSMREIKDNYKTVINDLSKRHREHLQFYGRDNDQRLTGTHETSSMDSFTWGVADRGSSVRVPRETAANGIGYIEDRRPSSLMDPYLVTGVLVETTISTV